MHQAKLLPLFLLALAACNDAPETVHVDDAYVRLPAVPGRPAAAYFTITGGDRPNHLVAIESEAVPRIELHDSMMAGGIMTMAPLAGVDVPAHGKVAFAPGGRHAMLFAMPAKLARGALLPLSFRFRSGAVVTVPARTLEAGEPAP